MSLYVLAEMLLQKAVKLLRQTYFRLSTTPYGAGRYIFPAPSLLFPLRNG